MFDGCVFNPLLRILGISIDFLDSQDVKNNELTAKLNRDFHLYLVCSPDFYS